MQAMTLKEKIRRELAAAKVMAGASSTDASRHFNQGKEWAFERALTLIEEIVG